MNTSNQEDNSMSTTPQMSIDYGKIERDKGIAQAVDHANEMTHTWSEDTFSLFKIWLSHKVRGHEFLLEQFRNEVGEAIEEPPSLRAFGIISVRAVKAGLIKKIGTAQVKNVKAHKATANLWAKV